MKVVSSLVSSDGATHPGAPVCGWGQDPPFPGTLPGGSGKGLLQLPDRTHLFSFQMLIPALTHSNVY